jgi:hypothetical protein
LPSSSRPLTASEGRGPESASSILGATDRRRVADAAREDEDERGDHGSPPGGAGSSRRNEGSRDERGALASKGSGDEAAPRVGTLLVAAADARLEGGGPGRSAEAADRSLKGQRAAEQQDDDGHDHRAPLR